MARISSGLALALSLALPLAVMLLAGSPQQGAAFQNPPQQDSPKQKAGDTFFAGALSECSAEKISVSRVVSGKTEKRTFKLTGQTKVENASGAKWDTGKLKVKQRVTVRYITGDDGDVATMIVVRTAQQKPK